MKRAGFRLHLLTVFAALTSLASLAVQPDGHPVHDADAATQVADALADGLAEAFRTTL